MNIPGSVDYRRFESEGVCVFTTSSGFTGEGASLNAAVKAAQAKEKEGGLLSEQVANREVICGSILA